MQNNSFCLIEQSLSALASSAQSKHKVNSILLLLKTILSALLQDPTKENVQTLDKDNALFSSQAIDSSQLHSLLILLGYHEDQTRYIHHPSDENAIKLTRCLSLLESHLKREEGILAENSNFQIPNRIELEQIRKQSGSNEEALNSKSRPFSGKLKDILLSKHLKKEQTNDMVKLIKKDKRPTSRSSDFAFNTNGYFHQSGNKTESKKNKSFIRELFHQHEHDSKGWNSSSSNARLF